MKPLSLGLTCLLILTLGQAAPTAGDGEPATADDGGARPAEPAPAVERPHDPWVFRSILDGRSRIITIALHPRLWIAYDAQHQGLYRAWPGGVNFTGAVYNYSHGPQPSVDNPVIYLSQTDGDLWSVEKPEGVGEPRVSYRGYTLDKTNSVTLHYAIDVGGHEITIHETPSASPHDGAMSLVQCFVVEGLPEGYALRLRVTAEHERGPTQRTIAGHVKLIEAEEGDFENPAIIALRFAADGESTLTTTWREQAE